MSPKSPYGKGLVPRLVLWEVVEALMWAQWEGIPKGMIMKPSSLSGEGTVPHPPIMMSSGRPKAMGLLILGLSERQNEAFTFIMIYFKFQL